VELHHREHRRLLPGGANGVVYSGSFDGNLYLFDLAGGLAAPGPPR
jgi:hypothetical protein